MRMLGRILVCLVILSGFAGMAASWFWTRYTGPGPLSQPVALVIPRGATLEDVAETLEKAGVIADGHAFWLGAMIEGKGRKFRTGEYQFPAGISARAAGDLLISGKTLQRRLTIAEGLTVKQVIAQIRQNDALEGDVALPPEGSLLPDTWFYSWGDSRERFVERQRRAMSQLVGELWRQRAPNLPLRSQQEAIVLASIVEKETAIAAERPRVAAVFLNRLRRGMKLQADPTVVYGLNDGAGPLDRPLSRADLENPHAWNTYVIDGLPPTPIANPGRAAIEAVFKPADSDELFFVADGRGGHVFARTLADHNRNVARLRSIERERATRAN